MSGWADGGCEWEGEKLGRPASGWIVGQLSPSCLVELKGLFCIVFFHFMIHIYGIYYMYEIFCQIFWVFN